jgi:hypothetical protein
MKRILVVFSMLAATPARADDTRFDTAGLTNAINALSLALANGDYRSDDDPLVRDVVSRMTAATAALDSPRLPVTGRDSLVGLCFPAGDMGHAYITAALKAKIAATIDPVERAKVEAEGIDGVTASHVATYFPMVLLSAKCNLAHLTMITKMVATIPLDKRTANQIKFGRELRDGVYHAVRGAIRMTISLFVDARREAMLEVLARYSKEIAQTMTADQKADLIATITIAKTSWPQRARVSGQVLAVALSSSECSALCAQ